LAVRLTRSGIAAATRVRVSGAGGDARSQFNFSAPDFLDQVWHEERTGKQGDDQ
jgi:hypothetical protein